ncbi:aspartate/methionine/tyrosine aminotransferase [Thermoflavifilum aggregans]|uniref:Aminotransferase n=1 Tax=Thermoflavifilum aggregans TaxID=454188 RepID=A0A2M9CUH2_9BACT|nr:aminotransferase class I/II-fold pyridoxal phosphate-dependent enzyme [Thermoflavifilum aggregans]PJJ75572.1 aspartate/methionine/tyrosine aminotransferase [Thermoflavifilum aggregans]
MNKLSLAKRLQGTDEYYFSKKLREIEVLNQSGAQVINLGIGSPDLPPHPDVIATLAEQAARPEVHGYQSYRGAKALREAIAAFYRQWYGVVLDPESEILPLIGSKEGIVHISMTYLNEGDEVLVPDPGYPTYRAASQLAGAVCRTYALREDQGWLPDFEALSRIDLSRVKIMWLNYPHMPTGTLPTREFFEQCVDFASRHGILLCHDNPYSFILNDKPMSMLCVPGAKEVVLELNSLSKSANMAGWRVGMLCGQAGRISEVLRFKSNMDSGMFLPVQLAAAKALSLPASWYHSLNETYARRREKIWALLRQLGCTWNPRQAGLFVWAHIPAGWPDGFAFSDAVLHQGHVFITPGGIFGQQGKEYIRLSLCQPESVLEEALQRIQLTHLQIPETTRV